MTTIKEIAKGKRFNGKVYGKPGSYSIYVNNEKIEVCDEIVNDFIKEEKEFEELKKSIPEVLNSRECQLLAVEKGIEKEFVELSFEQLKEKISLFEVEKIEKEANGIKAVLQIARHNGEIVSVWAGNSIGASFYANKNNQEQLISQFK